MWANRNDILVHRVAILSIRNYSPLFAPYNYLLFGLFMKRSGDWGRTIVQVSLSSIQISLCSPDSVSIHLINVAPDLDSQANQSYMPVYEFRPAHVLSC